MIGGAETGNQGPDARLGDVLRDAMRALESSPPADPLTRAAAEQTLGRALMSLGMLPEARRLLQSAEAGFAHLPEDADARVDVAVALAELLYYEGQYAEAEARFRELLAAERAAAGRPPTDRAGVLLNNLGACLRRQGRFDEAIAMQREAIAVRAAAFGENSLEVAESRNNLGSALFQKGDIPGAVEQFEIALAIRRSLLRPDHPLIVRLLSNLGLVQLRAGHIDEAAALLLSAAEQWEAAFGPEHPGRVSATISLSMALRQLNRHDEAIDWLERTAAWQRAHQPDKTAQLAATEAHIGITLAEQGHNAEAEAILTTVLPILRAGGNDVAGITRTATEALAALYERAGRVEEAEVLRATVRPAGQP